MDILILPINSGMGILPWKIYDYVYEGTDGNVYVSDSSFDQPGGSTQLYPN